MTLTIDRSIYDALGFDLDAAVADFVAAKEAHKLTVGVPAPTAPAIVEEVVMRGGYTILEPGDDPIPSNQVPQKISDRQFFQGLAEQGIITEAEALAAVKTGEIPAAMQAMVAQLPEANRFAANMLLSGATEFKRSHPLTETFGAAFGWTAEQIDAFWSYCAAL